LQEENAMSNRRDKYRRFFIWYIVYRSAI